MAQQTYTFKEEILNATTHGIGTLLSLAGMIFLLWFAHQNEMGIWYLAGFGIFGFTLILLYISSTLYHSFPPGKWKERFHMMDHIAIYLLIAGTYTPVTITVMRGNLGWTIFAVIWSCAFIGILMKVLWFGKFKYLSLALYAIMGWMIILAIKPLQELLTPESLFFMMAGGASYTIGIAFYVWKKLKFGHTIWHLFVLGGSICHLFTMYYLM